MSLLGRPMPRLHSGRRPFGAGVPVWTVAAQASVVLFFFHGFGITVVEPLLNPKPGFVINMILLASIVLFAPRGQFRKVVLSFTTVLFFTWWGAAIAWTPLVGEWINTTITQLSWVLLMIVVASVLPLDTLIRTILGAIYAMVAYSFLYTAMHPGDSTVLINYATGELVNVGWRGAFEHKNVLASFMVLGMLFVLGYEERRGVRRTAMFAMVGLVLLSRSGTGAGGMVSALVAFWFAKRVSRVRGTKASVTIVLSLLISIVAITGVLTFLPAIVQLYGKDLTFSGRTDIWMASLQAIRQEPWTGYSFGGIWLDPTKEPTFGIVRRLGFIVFHAHNGAIELMLLLGVVGLALYLLMFGAAVRDGWRLRYVDARLSQVVIAFAVLVVVSSVSEVLVLGPWLSLLVLLRTMSMRTLREAANAARPATHVARRGGAVRQTSRPAAAEPEGHPDTPVVRELTRPGRRP
jgi:O-antigen ligase